MLALAVLGAAVRLSRPAERSDTARRELPGSKPPTYLIHHSASVFLIDPAGRLRVMAPFGTPLDDVLHDVRALLKE